MAKTIKHTKNYQKHSKKNKKHKSENDIVTFLRTSSIKDIQQNLRKVIQKNKPCNIILGQGVYGRVYVNRNENEFIKFNDKQIPFVVKEPIFLESDAKIDLMTYVSKKDHLYIYSVNGITTEMIMLQFIKKIYHKSPHLPLLLDYSTCYETGTVDKIMTQRHGFDEIIQIEKPQKKNNVDTLVRINMLFPTQYLFQSYFVTLDDLLQYVSEHQTKEIIKLPNEVTCKVVSLLEYLLFGMIHTYLLLCNHGIYVQDLHGGNIFLNWKEASADQEIIYCVNDHQYKFSTFGIILKFGDVGIGSLEINKNITLLSALPSHFVNDPNAEEKYEDVIELNQPFFNFLRQKKMARSLLGSFAYIFGRSILQKCCFFSFIQFANEFTILLDEDVKHLLTPEQIISTHFQKYLVPSSFDKSGDTIVALDR